MISCFLANGKGEQFGGLLVTVQLDLCKRSGVTFDRLTDPSFAAVKLHRSLNFERRGIGRVARDSNENWPFLVISNTVVDNLGAS